MLPFQMIPIESCHCHLCIFYTRMIFDIEYIWQVELNTLKREFLNSEKNSVKKRCSYFETCKIKSFEIIKKKDFFTTYVVVFTWIVKISFILGLIRFFLLCLRLIWIQYIRKIILRKYSYLRTYFIIHSYHRNACSLPWFTILITQKPSGVFFGSFFVC